MTSSPAPAAGAAAGTPPAGPTRVALVGARGFGRQHLAALRRLASEGRVVLTDVVDPAGPVAAADLPSGPPPRHHDGLEALLASGSVPDVVVIATPISTHHQLAAAALRAGADVLLEKPATATLAQLEDLLAVTADTGRLVQVGFQSLGSHALPAIADLVAQGRIGQVRHVTATGLWLRTRDYFARSPWAGRRRVGDVEVVDGVVTNPLAHAVVTALALAGARTTDDVLDVRTELFRANPDIESDDTSVVLVRTATGVPVTCALTLCAEQELAPVVSVEGTLGRIELRYKSDEVTLTDVDGVTTTTTYGRTPLIEDLLDRRADGGPLLVPLESTGAFARVLEAVRTADDPRQVPAEYVRWDGEGGTAHPVLPGVEELMARVVKAGTGLRGLGVPWAEPAADTAGVAETAGTADTDRAEVLLVAGREVARVRGTAELPVTTSPRPVLHPVRTLAGTVVTDHQPLDHVWHLGLGVAVQDVDGTNVWGGRTFTREAGAYVWRRDHGRAERTAAALQPAGDAPGRLAEELDWLDPAGAVLLQEQRTWTWGLLDGEWAGRAWWLGLDVTLLPPGDGEVALGSPGSNGRPGGGYGGIFWRLPAVRDAEVFTAAARGEDDVHGSTAPWLAWTGHFTRPAWQVPVAEVQHAAQGGPASLVLAADDADPWFVRVAGYPGIGRSLAWSQPVRTSRERPVRRRLLAAVVDGIVDEAEAAGLATLLADVAPDPGSAPGAAR